MWIIFSKIIKNSLKKMIILKSQQRFRNEKRNVFTEEVRKITLNANNDKIIQSTD